MQRWSISMGLIVAAALFGGCDGEASNDPSSCEKGGQVFQPGEVASSCGEECTCQDDGTFECVAVPTFAPCGSCTFGSETFFAGDVRSSCGETCTCLDDSTWDCVYTDVACGCVVDGEFHEVGSSFPAGDGCNTCTCVDNGGQPTAECTLAECVSCTYEGMTYQPGETWSADRFDCNTCTCNEDGTVACTELECGGWSCEYLGVYYAEGDSFPAIDGCNTCTCLAGGGLACTDVGCPGACELQGEVVVEGATVPLGDGCNTCTCSGSMLSCTAQVCACDPASEWWRSYAGTVEECALIDFDCFDNLQNFYNDCGCGCAQDLALCGPVVPASMAAQCPLSQVE